MIRRLSGVEHARGSHETWTRAGFWHVLSGEGQIWRRDATAEETTVLERGVSIGIPVGTAFQYRCDGAEPLQFEVSSRWV